MPSSEEEEKPAGRGVPMKPWRPVGGFWGPFDQNFSDDEEEDEDSGSDYSGSSYEVPSFAVEIPTR